MLRKVSCIFRVMNLIEMNNKIILGFMLLFFGNLKAQDTLAIDSLKFSNAFSPNKDGVNDVYFIQGLEFHPVNTFSVYNDSGILVYLISNYLNNWDGVSNTGSYKDKELVTGLYYFKFNTASGINVSGKIVLDR